MHGVKKSTRDDCTNVTEDSKDTEKEVVLLPHPRKWDIVWREVMIITFLHIGAVYGTYLFLMEAKWKTCVFAYLMYVATTMGVTIGAHRLWTHRAYKANLPLRVILLTFFTMAFQYSVVSWVRIHRMHHKYCDTDADPHNATRGFFFSHVGWLLIRKHPQVKAHTVDLSDLLDDPILRFQHKYYWWLLVPICFIVPTYIPTLWGEQAWIAFNICVCLRQVCTLHAIWLINSAAHMWGNKPYDKHIRPSDIQILSFVAIGDGFHNYHHTFPWDYRSAELGGYSHNLGQLFIDIMAKIGWAYDLKTVPNEFIEKRVKRTGDGTHPVWGWNDPDLSLEDRKASKIKHRR